MALILMLLLGTVGFFGALAGIAMLAMGSGVSGFVVLATSLLLLTAAFFVDRTRESASKEK